jgi:hypothetical protein
VFLKTDDIVPMHGNFMSVEKPCLGEDQATVFDRSFRQHQGDSGCRGAHL